MKSKHKNGYTISHPTDWKKGIRGIENRYIEVFYEGSFKFYPKLYFQNDFPHQLETIRIDDWANECLHKKGDESCC